MRWGVVFACMALASARAEPPLPRLLPEGEPVPFTEEERETFPGGCSWYCGAPDIRVTASSALEESGGRQYPADQAHDMGLGTAWSEGVPGSGIGEKIAFEFLTTEEDTTNLAVTSCGIAAGYQASEELFRLNARPKRLRLFLDGKAVATLELKDAMGMQYFIIPELRLERPSRHTLALEILDVYPGTKHQDTCITEVHFGGKGDMH